MGKPDFHNMADKLQLVNDDTLIADEVVRSWHPKAA
jgi:hypothetical protein